MYYLELSNIVIDYKVNSAFLHFFPESKIFISVSFYHDSFSLSNRYNETLNSSCKKELNYYDFHIFSYLGNIHDNTRAQTRADTYKSERFVGTTRFEHEFNYRIGASTRKSTAYGHSYSGMHGRGVSVERGKRVIESTVEESCQ